MGVEIRPVAEAELDDLVRCDAAAFGDDLKPEDFQEARALLHLDRTMAAFDDGRLVGSTAVLPLELTLPGPVVVALAGVTYVAVLPTHRRRGLLTAMMAGLLADARRRGERVAALLASEGAIYGRFGFGPATSAASYAVERVHARFTDSLVVPGRFVLLEGPEAERALPDLFDRARRSRPGEVSRPAGWWRWFFDDREDEREGMTRRFLVAHEGAGGDVDGYAAYRYRHGAADATAQVDEVVGLDGATRLALLRYCFDLDLVSRAELAHFPVDEPVRWALTDPRRLETTGLEDRLWVRLLDVAPALAARRYAATDRLVLDVEDGFVAGNSGRYELEAGLTGAECRATGAPADLSLGAAELGAVYLGGVRFSTLGAAGRVREHTPGALVRATALFATDPAPYCGTEF